MEAESIRFDPVRRRQRGLLQAYERAVRQLDLAARNVRVLARAGVFLTRGTRPVPDPLTAAVTTLASAVRDLGTDLAALPLAPQRDGEFPGTASHVVRTALDAVRLAAGALEETHDVPVVMIVGQVRATAVDLMLGSGLPRQQVLAAADEALFEQDTLGA